MLGMDNLLAYEGDRDEDYCVPAASAVASAVAGTFLRPWSDRSSALSELSTVSGSVAGSTVSDVSSQDIYDFPPASRLSDSRPTPDDNVYAVPVERVTPVKRDDDGDRCSATVAYDADRSDASDGYDTYDTPNSSFTGKAAAETDSDTLKRAPSGTTDLYDTPPSCADKLAQMDIYDVPLLVEGKGREGKGEEADACDGQATYDIPQPATLPKKQGRRSGGARSGPTSEVYDIPPQVSRDTAPCPPRLMPASPPGAGAGPAGDAPLTADVALPLVTALADQITRHVGEVTGGAAWRAGGEAATAALAAALSELTELAERILAGCTQLAVRQLAREVREQTDAIAAARRRTLAGGEGATAAATDARDAVAELVTLVTTNAAALFSGASCKGRPPRPPTKPKPQLSHTLSKGGSVERDVTGAAPGVTPGAGVMPRAVPISQSSDMASYDMYDVPQRSADRLHSLPGGATDDASRDEDYVQLTSTAPCTMRRSDGDKSAGKRAGVYLDGLPPGGATCDSATASDGLSETFRTKLERVQRESAPAPAPVVPRPLGPADIQVIRFYAAQMPSHEGVLLDAVDALFACVRRSQPPHVFVAYSRCVVLAAHTLVYVSDAVARSTADTLACRRVTAGTRVLCDSLRAAVTATKHAAVHYPAVAAVQEMIDRVVDVSHAGNTLRVIVEQAAAWEGGRGDGGVRGCTGDDRQGGRRVARRQHPQGDSGAGGDLRGMSGSEGSVMGSEGGIRGWSVTLYEGVKGRRQGGQRAAYESRGGV